MNTDTKTHDSSDFRTLNKLVLKHPLLTCNGGSIAKNQDPVLCS